jgi:hypothetical protein
MKQKFKFRSTWFTIILLVVFCMHSNCQTIIARKDVSLPASKKNVIEAEKRTLLIALTGNTEMDQNIKDLVDRCWKFNTEHHFVSYDDLKGIVSDESSKYTILSVNMVNAPATNNKFFRFSVYLSEKYSRRKALFYTDVLGFYNKTEFEVKRKDIIFALKHIQNHFIARKAGILRMGYSEVRKYRGVLPTKTLLLDSALFDKKLDSKQIFPSYTLPYKVTDEKEIEEALMNNDDKYACVQIVPIADVFDVRLHYVIDCENCNIISYGDTFNGFGDFGFSNLINKKHLRLYQSHGENE